MQSERRGQVVLLGLDALDPDLLQEWTAAGKLPSLKRLMEVGSWALTSGPELLCEHGIWVSMLGGVSWARHGFHFFWQPQPRSYNLQLARGHDCNVPPFWSELRGTDRSVFVLDPPDTAPVRGLAGFQVSEWATHSHFPPLKLASEPVAAGDELRKLFGAREKIGETIGSSADADRQTLDRLVARAARKGAAIRTLLAKESYDLIVAVFAEAHTGGHQLWEYRRGAKGDGPRPEQSMGDGLLRLYQALDREVGAIVDLLPESAQLFVVSSVGILPHYPIEGLMDSFCRTLGYQVPPVSGPDAHRSGRRSLTALLRQLLPETVRSAINRVLPLDVQERMVSEKFVAATDWSRTRAYAMPGWYTGSVRVNLRGREPDGIVEPGMEYEELLNDLEQDFRALTHARTGEPVIENVVRTHAVFGDDLHQAIPDLLVYWRPHDEPLDRVVHPRAELSQPRHAFHRGSHHTLQGFVIGAGTAIRPAGHVADVDPLSIAPTLLGLLGIPAPGHMNTAPLSSWLRDTQRSTESMANAF